MTNIRALVNIGERLASELSASSIATAEDLMNAGSVGAARQLEAHGFSICANKLYALEGAVRGIRWHGIPAEERSALWETFLDQSNCS